MGRRRRWAAPVATLAVLGLLTLGSGPALADGGNPVGDLTKTVQKQLKPVTDAVTPPQVGARASTPSRNPGTPSSKAETPPNDVADPKAPDHAGAEVLKSSGAGQPLVDAGQNSSTIRDNDGTSSHAGILAIGGMEIPGTGAHADSTGTRHDHNAPADPATTPVCDSSTGALCLDMLYADANATDNGTESHSDGTSELAGACLGGSKGGSGASCDSPVRAGLSESKTSADRNQSTGRTTASSSSQLASLCASPPADVPLPESALPGVGGDCAVGASLLSSNGHADSGGAKPSASRDSSVASVTAGGMTYDEGTLPALPEGCQLVLACAYTDQGETYTGPSSLAGHAQEALKIQLLPPGLTFAAVAVPLLDVTGARTETLVHNDGGEPAAVRTSRHRDSVRGVEGAARPAATVAADTGLLPNTGGPSSGLLAAGLLALGAGAILMAESRRRQLLAQQA